MIGLLVGLAIGLMLGVVIGGLAHAAGQNARAIKLATESLDAVTKQMQAQREANARTTTTGQPVN